MENGSEMWRMVNKCGGWLRNVEDGSEMLRMVQ